MTEYADVKAESARQSALTESLGQVKCDGNHGSEAVAVYALSCFRCEAVV